MQLSVASFPLCACDFLHHLNKYSNCFFFFLYEEFLFCADGGGSHKSEEAVQFLNKLLSTQCFLQVSPTFHPEVQVIHFGGLSYLPHTVDSYIMNASNLEETSVSALDN